MYAVSLKVYEKVCSKYLGTYGINETPKYGVESFVAAVLCIGKNS